MPRRPDIKNHPLYQDVVFGSGGTARGVFTKDTTEETIITPCPAGSTIPIAESAVADCAIAG